MHTLATFRDVLSRIKFGDWTFEVNVQSGMRFELKVVVDGARCNITGEPMSWKGRAWPLSVHMTDGEIVQTAFKAVMTAMEHEIREQFTYRDAAVFDPHYDIEKLVDLRKRPDALKERADHRAQVAA